MAAIAGLLSSAPVMATAPSARADLVITGVTVANVRERRFDTDQVIAIRRGRIIHVGATSRRWPHARMIDGRHLIALPGFVDTHTHLWQHVARGLEPNRNLQGWARAVYPLAHQIGPGEAHDIIRAAAAQALLNGVTTVADFASANFSEATASETMAALLESHIGGGVVWWRPAVFLPWRIQDRQIAALRRQGGDRLSLWVGFGPLSFMPIPMVYDGIQTARRNGLRMTEHSMENLAEARDFAVLVRDYLRDTRLSDADRALLEKQSAAVPMSRSDALLAMSRERDDLLGDPVRSAQLAPSERSALEALPPFQPSPSPLGLLDAWGALDGFVAIHSVWPSQSDIALYGARQVAVSHNPESNMYLSSGVAPLRQYAAAGVPVTLGTDGAASNDRISMFDAMRTAWLLQRVSALEPVATLPLDGWYFLRAATLNGAAALGLGDRVGSIETGKEADLILLDRRGLSLAPSSDATLATVLVTSAEARDIAYVIADGHVVAAHGALVGLDARLLAARLTAISAVLRDREARGKRWNERIRLAAGQGQLAYRYRVIKLADSVGVEVTNGGDRPLTLTIAFAGTLFGGRTSMTMHPASLARYPSAPMPRFASYHVQLAPGQSLSIAKAAGSRTYHLRYGARTILREAPAGEQVALFVDE